MGEMIYGDKESSFVIDDATLAHLRIVIMNKLRRQEPFMLQLDAGRHAGTRSLWIAPSTALHLRFTSNAAYPIDRGRVEEMMRDANGPDGITLD